MNNKILICFAIVTCLAFQSCVSTITPNHNDYYFTSLVDNNVYLNNCSFVKGTVLGEIPFDLAWSVSKKGKGRINVCGSIKVLQTQELLPYSTFFLVKKGEGMYEIVDTVHNSDSSGNFSFEISEQKLRTHYLAIYAPGFRTNIYQLQKAKKSN